MAEPAWVPLTVKRSTPAFPSISKPLPCAVFAAFEIPVLQHGLGHRGCQACIHGRELARVDTVDDDVVKQILGFALDGHRIGAVRGVETIDRIAAGDAAAVPLLEDLCETMRDGSLCALGGFTPYPVLSALRGFPEEFGPAREAAE